MKKVIGTEKAPAAVGPYSQAIRAGDLLFVSGQLGIDPGTGKLVDGGVEKQTEQALRNLVSIIEAAGSDIGSVVKATVFLQNMSDFSTMNGVYGSFFESDPPARAAIEVAQLPLGGLVEIEAIVHLG